MALAPSALPRNCQASEPGHAQFQPGQSAGVFTVARLAQDDVPGAEILAAQDLQSEIRQRPWPCTSLPMSPS